jgi:hypothetical protein
VFFATELQKQYKIRANICAIEKVVGNPSRKKTKEVHACKPGGSKYIGRAVTQLQTHAVVVFAIESDVNFEALHCVQ